MFNMKNIIKERLRELRKENGYTQKFVAKAINKSETGYASWEQGLAEPNLNDIILICELYGVTSDYLIGLKDY